MATVTIRPDAISTKVSTGLTGPTIGGGAANAWVAVNDDTDVTSLSFNVSQGIALSLANPTIPANAVITAVKARVRHSTASTGMKVALYGPDVSGSSTLDRLAGALADDFSTTGATVTQTFTARTALHDGNAISIADCNSLEVVITNASYGPVSAVYEIYVDITYNEAPTLSSLVATSSTLRPLVTANMADPEGDVLERLRVKAFTAAQYGAGGFDPNTSTPTYDSGEVYTSTLAHTIAQDLVNGGTYRIWLQVADAGSGGRYNVITSGAGYVQITIAAPNTAVPALSVTADPTVMRQALAIVGKDNIIGSDDADFEGGLGVWTAQTNCAVAASTAFALVGSQSMRLTSTAAGNMAARTPTGLSGFPVLPSTAYSLLSAFRAAVSSRVCRVTAFWYKSDGTASATPSTNVSSGADTTVGFTNIGGGGVTSPSDAAFCAIQAQVDATGAASEVHYVDCALIAPGTTTTWSRGGVLSTRRFQVQRSDDGGTTWSDVTRTPVNGALTTYDLSTYAVSTTTQAVTVYDYEARRGATIPQYRVRSSVTISGSVFSSAWVTAASNSAMTTTGWWIKDLYDPTYNQALPLDSVVLDWISVERSSVYYPNGQANAIVLSDVPAGERVMLDLYTWTDAGYASLEAIRAGRNLVLLQSPYGDHLYCSFVGRRVMKQTPRPDGVRKPVVSVELVEVDAP